ncbi:MAG: alanine dehydrogenase [Opitutaceae bacterium]|nr:alanine dehydrogenase [Cytophagales bacterium]
MKPKGFKELAQEFALYPQESLQKVKEGQSSLTIGLPKEIESLENRIALTPGAVAILVNNGHSILVEANAGKPSKYADKEYSEAGAKICYSSKEVLQSDIILKVEPPTLNEITDMKMGATLISALQIAKQNNEYMEALAEKKITAIAYEFIEDKVGGRPVIRAMSEIAGSTVMLIASEYLNSVNNGKGIILGGITGVPPSKVVIIGAGTVAEYAARAAFGLGAEVKIFDNHIYKLRRLKRTLSSFIYTSTIDTETLSEALKEADVVIGALGTEENISPCVVTEQMVMKMPQNSIIIDVSIDQGGCFETSQITNHKNPIYKKHDVLHYCVPNIPSRVARTATTALSNIFTPILLQIGKYGGVEDLMFTKEWFEKGVYAYKGCVTKQALARRFNMKFTDLGLIKPSRQ